jgi:hypothetical protein
MLHQEAILSNSSSADDLVIPLVALDRLCCGVLCTYLTYTITHQVSNIFPEKNKRQNFQALEGYLVDLVISISGFVDLCQILPMQIEEIVAGYRGYSRR